MSRKATSASPPLRTKYLKNSVAPRFQDFATSRFPIAPSASVPASGDCSCAAARRVSRLADRVEAGIGDDAIVFLGQAIGDANAPVNKPEGHVIRGSDAS